MAKIVKPKHKLEPLKVKSVQRAVKKGDVPVIQVEGDYPTRYNEASAIMKDAEGLMAALKPVMQPDALDEVYRHNTERPWDAIASVVLEDANGKKTRVSFTSAYKASTEPVVEALFESIKTKSGAKPNINEYIGRTMVGTFDSGAFLGADGKFSQDRYDRITAGIQKVADQVGIRNPLSTEEVIKPVADFHQRRWTDFDRTTNERITAVLQNTVSFTPIADAAPAEESGS